MSLLETPMIERYWNQVGGTLVEEFYAVYRSETNGEIRIDAVIIPDGPKQRASQDEFILDGKDIILVQAKASRLGMYVMGQAVFSPKLIRRNNNPASIRPNALVNENDYVLGPLLEDFPDVEVVGISS
jgi:hypothetical protein